MKLKVYFLLLFLSLLISCSNNNEQTVQKESNKALKIIYDTLRIAPINKDFYFPTNLYERDSIYILNPEDTITHKSILKYNNYLWLQKNEWYSKALKSLKEPIIYNLDTSLEIYRFTWLRSFHNPLVIRIEKNNNGSKLFLKINNWSEGRSHTKLIIKKSNVISKNEWNRFIDKINRIEFWQLFPLDNRELFDGAEWVLEGKTKYRYHMVTRQSPDDTHNQYFRETCEYLIKLSKLRLTKSQIY